MIIVYGKDLKIENFKIIKNLMTPKGRLEKVFDEKYTIFIDYAHTPDALKNVLTALKKNKKK